MCFDICTINIRVSIRVHVLHLVFSNILWPSTFRYQIWMNPFQILKQTENLWLGRGARTNQSQYTSKMARCSPGSLTEGKHSNPLNNVWVARSWSIHLANLQILHATTLVLKCTQNNFIYSSSFPWRVPGCSKIVTCRPAAAPLCSQSYWEAARTVQSHGCRTQWPNNAMTHEIP